MAKWVNRPGAWPALLWRALGACGPRAPGTFGSMCVSAEEAGSLRGRRTAGHQPGRALDHGPQTYLVGLLHVVLEAQANPPLLLLHMSSYMADPRL